MTPAKDDSDGARAGGPPQHSEQPPTYEDAWDVWTASGEADVWESAVRDGIDQPAEDAKCAEPR